MRMTREDRFLLCVQAGLSALQTTHGTIKGAVDAVERSARVMEMATWVSEESLVAFDGGRLAPVAAAFSRWAFWQDPKTAALRGDVNRWLAQEISDRANDPERGVEG